MYTILVKDTNELIVSVKERIVQRNKLVDSLHFLASQTYKGEDMSSYSVLLEYKLPVSKAYKTAMLELTDELYKDMLEYKLPFDTEFTKEPGDVEVQLTFFKNEMGEDGVITQRVRHTTSTYHYIYEGLDYFKLDVSNGLSHYILYSPRQKLTANQFYTIYITRQDSLFKITIQ